MIIISGIRVNKNANIFENLSRPCGKCGGTLYYKNGNKCVKCRREYKANYTKRNPVYTFEPLTETEKRYVLDSYTGIRSITKIAKKLLRRSLVIKQFLISENLLDAKYEKKLPTKMKGERHYVNR